VGAGLTIDGLTIDAGLTVAAGLAAEAGPTAGVAALAGVGSITGPGPPMHSQPLTIMNVHGGLQAGMPAGRLTGPDEAPSAMATAVLSAKIPGMMSTRDIVPLQRPEPGAPRRCGTPRFMLPGGLAVLEGQAAGVAVSDRVHHQAVQAHIARRAEVARGALVRCGDQQARNPGRHIARGGVGGDQRG
jgi:hypothetical protein